MLHLFAVIYFKIYRYKLQDRYKHVCSRHLSLRERNACYNGTQFSHEERQSRIELKKLRNDKLMSLSPD